MFPSRPYLASICFFVHITPPPRAPIPRMEPFCSRHPNVVRYFVREEAGEFVYLALQLCQLSLHNAMAQIHGAMVRPIRCVAWTPPCLGGSRVSVLLRLLLCQPFDGHPPVLRTHVRLGLPLKIPRCCPANTYRDGRGSELMARLPPPPRPSPFPSSKALGFLPSRLLPPPPDCCLAAAATAAWVAFFPLFAGPISPKS